MPAKSLRPFIGSKDFDRSRNFYLSWGFSESKLGPDLSVFSLDSQSFYLQKHYVKDWINNTMLFLESDILDNHFTRTISLDLPSQFKGVRVSEIKVLDWGRVYFVHDPSGILWQVGEFKD